jgi:uncharacterized protein (DUF433 family)
MSNDTIPEKQPDVEELQQRIQTLEDCLGSLVALLQRLGFPLPSLPTGPSLPPLTGAESPSEPTTTNGSSSEQAVPPWEHLVARAHRWRRQLYIKGRNMTVRQLVGTIKANRWGEDEAAKSLDLPVEAIKEALRYAAENEELLTFETAYENLLLAKKGYGRGTHPVPR